MTETFKNMKKFKNSSKIIAKVCDIKSENYSMAKKLFSASYF